MKKLFGPHATIRILPPTLFSKQYVIVYLSSMKFVTLLIISVWALVARPLYSKPFPSFSIFHFTSLPDLKSNETRKSEVKCENGVCRIEAPTSNGLRGGFDNTESKIDELMKLGWSKDDATRALTENNNDVEAAALWLEAEQEELEEQKPLLAKLVNSGWNEEISKIALKENNGNLTAAMEMLESEEKNMLTNFENSVQDMLNNGWDEIVARQALLAQWHLDKAKFNGENTTVPREVLDGIRPTLKKLNETQPVDTAKSKQGQKSSQKATARKPETKPARKEDVVFDVTLSNLQKVVLDSDVPVLLDVYADWCGPCKQLGPMLEDAAVRAGGLFRLAKVNSDKERDIVECLQVTGLPTVYAVVKGKLSDRFVGMLQPNQIQDFLVRAVTGFGERAQSKDLTDQDLSDMTYKIRNLAGLASISFTKKEKLFALVDDCMQLDDAFLQNNDGSLSIQDSVKTALIYIDNCRKDVLNPKYRSISTSSKAFREKIGDSISGKRLLEVAGFRLNSTDERLTLVHNNSAILSLIQQRVDKVVSEKKFRSHIPKKPNRAVAPSIQVPVPQASSKIAESSQEHKQIERNSDIGQTDGQILLNIRGIEDKVIQKYFNEKTKLHQALVKFTGLSLQNIFQLYDIEVRSKSLKKVLHEESEEFDQLLQDLVGEENSLSISLRRKSETTVERVQKSARSSSRSAKKGNKVNNLFSSGILSNKAKKNNEYFGGDSTVVESGVEDDEEENDADE